MKYLPKSKWKKSLVIFLLIVVLMQFFPRPSRNIGSVQSNIAIDRLYAIPDTVLRIFKAACYDCHSNNTRYPWYSNIQPVAWYLNRHVIHGKDELNFDEFGSYSRRRRQSKLKSIASQVKDGEMPLSSYKLMHKAARLSSTEKEMIIQWAANPAVTD